jgi:hypothetical protein
MPQPHKREALTIPLHLFCSSCCCLMHLTTAHVTADGTESIGLYVTSVLPRRCGNTRRLLANAAEFVSALAC